MSTQAGTSGGSGPTADDWRLPARMLLTLAAVTPVNLVFGALLLVVVLVPMSIAMLVIGLNVLVLPDLLATAVEATVGPASLFGLDTGTTMLVVCIAVVVAAFAFVVPVRTGPDMLVENVEGHVVDADREPRLVGLLGSVARQANVPTPRAAVVETGIPRSFAAGRKNSGTVVVTRGLLETLDDDELRAVLAHEVSHLLNRDASVICYSAFYPLAFAMASDDGGERSAVIEPDGGESRLLDWIVSTVPFTPDLDWEELSDGENGLVHRWQRQALVVFILLEVLLMIIFLGYMLYFYLQEYPIDAWVLMRVPLFVVVVGFMHYFFSYFVYGAARGAFLAGQGLVVLLYPVLAVAQTIGATLAAFLSQTRELAADRGAAAITGDPASLASALETLHGAERSPGTDLRATEAVEPLSILPIGDEDPEGIAGRFEFRTHPPVKERIERLREMARRQETESG